MKLKLISFGLFRQLREDLRDQLKKFTIKAQGFNLEVVPWRATGALFTTMKSHQKKSLKICKIRQQILFKALEMREQRLTPQTPKPVDRRLNLVTKEENLLIIIIVYLSELPFLWQKFKIMQSFTRKVKHEKVKPQFF